MATEYRLSFTAQEIDEKLSAIDEITTKLNNVELNHTIINVKDPRFGAMGDGSPHIEDGVDKEKEAIIKAFTYAAEHLPATIYFPKGEYVLSKGSLYINMPNGNGGLTICGDGAKQSIIKYAEDWESSGSWVALRIQPE